ncbi:MAG: tetratricopeptide repeat protein [Alphaproteobacteria bacterium]
MSFQMPGGREWVRSTARSIMFRFIAPTMLSLIALIGSTDRADAFAATICNKGDTDLFLTVLGQTGFGRWYTNGWVKVTPGRCSTADNPWHATFAFSIGYRDANGNFGLANFQPKRKWGASETFKSYNRKFCVNQSDEFYNTGSLGSLAVCSSGEKLVRFSLYVEGLKNAHYTLNIPVRKAVLHASYFNTTNDEAQKAREQPRFARACEGGDARACYDLGSKLRYGEGLTEDKARAQALFDQACQLGDANSCYYAASMFAAGEGAALDKVRARALYDQACDGGDATSCYYAGLMFSAGDGGAQDKKRARVLSDLACKGGVARGCGATSSAAASKVPSPSMSARQVTLDQGCRAGKATYCTALGFVFYNGDQGVSQDKARARELFERACKGGDAAGCNNLSFTF